MKVGQNMAGRKEKRIRENRKAHLVDRDKTYNVQVTDISTHGMAVKTDAVIPTFKEIDVILKLNGRELQLKGSVRWTNEHIRNPEIKMKEVGISLRSSPLEYVDYVDDLFTEEQDHTEEF